MLRATVCRSGSAPSRRAAPSGAGSCRRGRRERAVWFARSCQSTLLDAFEALHALAGIDIAGKDVAVRIDGHRVDPVELAGIAPLPAEGADFLAVLAQENVDLVIGAVADEQVFLLRVRGEADI